MKKKEIVIDYQTYENELLYQKMEGYKNACSDLRYLYLYFKDNGHLNNIICSLYKHNKEDFDIMRMIILGNYDRLKF